jgi:hypothetical protein
LGLDRLGALEVLGGGGTGMARRWACRPPEVPGTIRRSTGPVAPTPTAEPPTAPPDFAEQLAGVGACKWFGHVVVVVVVVSAALPLLEMTCQTRKDLSHGHLLPGKLNHHPHSNALPV